MASGTNKRIRDTVQPAETAALALLTIALALALFYPETFIVPALQPGGLSFIPLNLFAPIIAAGALACMFLRREVLRFGLVDATMILFFLYFIARAVVSGQELLASGKYVIYGISIFYLATIALRRKHLREIFLGLLVVLSLAIIFYGFVEFALQKNIILEDYISNTVVDPEQGVHRSGSLLAHPVVYGATLIQIIPFLGYVWIRSEKRRNRFIGGIATIAAIIALILTFSKGSWIVAGLYSVALVLVVLYRRPHGGINAIVGAAVSAVAAIIVFWRQIYLETVSRAEGSIVVRYATWEGAVEAIRNKPIVGYGFKQGSRKLQEMEVGRIYYEITSRPIPVDNNYLNILLDLGIVGLGLWITFLLTIVVNAIMKLADARHDTYFIAAGLVSVIGIAVNALTFEAWIVWPTYLLFMAIAGTLHGESYNSGERSSA